MQTITNAYDLKEAIRNLEILHKSQEYELKNEFQQTFETFRPINLIKSSIKDFVSSPDLLNNIVNAGIGLATGLVSRKILVGGSHNPIMKLIGTVMEFGIAGVITKNPEGIKTMGWNLLNNFLGKREA